jgi:hypothetical protein
MLATEERRWLAGNRVGDSLLGMDKPTAVKQRGAEVNAKVVKLARIM